VAGVNGLTVRLLEAGEVGRPALLLLHGFPELAWSWRKVMGPLAAAGFHVIAPDQRGYGGTTGWDGRYDGDVASFRQMNLAQDMVELVFALGLSEVWAVIGHDFGSPVAAHCALVRPDLFRRVVLMSAPFGGTPAPGPPTAAAGDIHGELARLAPPRKLYQRYYSGPEADADMRNAPQGLQAFLRAYYHVKSADWTANQPRRLAGWSGDQLAELPAYYVMPLGATMPEAVAPYMPSDADVAACQWLTNEELGVYVRAFARTGFQGGLNWYRCSAGGLVGKDLRLFSGRKIAVPALFVAGAADWGVYQSPGALEAMQKNACSDLRDVRLIEGAGHWVQQERPEAVAEALLAFLCEPDRVSGLDRDEWRHLERFAFGNGAEPELADELCDLVLAGVKTATCWPISEGQQTEVGKRMVVTDGAGRPRAVIETVELGQKHFGEVDAEFASHEGEGERTLDDWRRMHRSYFEKHGVFAPDMMLWCERFRLIGPIMTG
jgi:pimeloyl-ACP methyl ester carboxylesterase/uncharacterized protein YhfF